MASTDSPVRWVKFSYSLRSSLRSSQIAEPRPKRSQCEYSSAAPKSYKPSPLSEPDRIQIDTEHGTSSRPPCCWCWTCPSILEQRSLQDEHKLCSLWHPKESDPCREGNQPSTFATSGNSYHQSVEDPNPISVVPSLDLRLVRIMKIRNRLYTTWRTD
jgi:hypothetical protein